MRQERYINKERVRFNARSTRSIGPVPGTGINADFKKINEGIKNAQEKELLPPKPIRK